MAAAAALQTILRYLSDYPTPIPNDRVAQRGLSAEAQREWLSRSLQWPDLSPDKQSRRWRPVKVLGTGTYGMVGLWEYLGRVGGEGGGGGSGGTGNGGGDADGNGDEMEDVDDTPRFIAVKQASGQIEKMALRWESRLLQQVLGARSEHVVKLYKGYHLDAGTGTDEKRDPIPFSLSLQYDPTEEVARIYLEYCPGGDLFELLKIKENRAGNGTSNGTSNGNGKDIRFFTEESLWRMMLCMFQSVSVLARGTEDPRPEADVEGWKPVVHFDTKINNIMVGEKDDAEHKRYPLLKLVDFGNALPMPSNPKDWAKGLWVDLTTHRGTASWGDCTGKIPEFSRSRDAKRSVTNREKEQRYDIFPEDLRTWQTSIWAVAATLFALISGHELDTTLISPHPLPPHQPTVCMPSRLFNPSIFPYSSALINLLCQCLSLHPNDRPDLLYLLSHIGSIVARYDADALAANEPIPTDHFVDPDREDARYGALQAVDPIPVTQPFPRPQMVRTFLPLSHWRAEHADLTATPLYFGGSVNPAVISRPPKQEWDAYPFLPLYKTGLYGPEPTKTAPLVPVPVPPQVQMARRAAAFKALRREVIAGGDMEFEDWWDEVRWCFVPVLGEVPEELAVGLFVSRAPVARRHELWAADPDTVENAVRVCRGEAMVLRPGDERAAFRQRPGTVPRRERSVSPGVVVARRRRMRNWRGVG